MTEINFRISASLDKRAMNEFSSWLDDCGKKARNFSKMFESGGTPRNFWPNASNENGTRGKGTSSSRPRPTGAMGPSYNLDTPSGLAQWDENVLRPEAPFLEQMLGSTSAQGNRNLNPSRPNNFMDSFRIGTGIGSGTGSASSQFGHSLGGLARQYLPALSIAGAVTYAGSQVAQGYNMWQQSSQPIDQLSHSLGTAAQGVEQFRQQIVKAGASFGESMQQSTQAALTFGQTFGNIGQSAITNMVGSTASWSLQNGLTYQQGNQITAASGILGITSGTGASMTTGQYQNMLSNVTRVGGMMGRQGAVASEYTGLANIVGSMNPTIANPQGLASMVASLSKTGLQALQGQRGEQVAGQFISGMMQPNSYLQQLMIPAIAQASGGKISNPLQILQLLQSGPQTKIPGMKMTVGQVELKKISSITSNPLQQASLLYADGQASSLANAEAIIEANKKNGLFTTKIPTKNTSHPWYSMYDLSNISQQTWDVGKSIVGGAVAPFATMFHSLGFSGSQLVTMAGTGMIAKYGLRGAASKVTGIPNSIADAINARKGPYSTSWMRGGKSIFSKAAGGATRGVTEDVVGEGADLAGVGGLEALGGAFDATGIGAPIGIGLGLLGAGIGGYELWKHHQHASATSSHAAQVKQSSAKFPTTINTLTIDNLKINTISLPSSAGGSAVASALSAGSSYAPTSGSSSSGTSWWGDFTHWLDRMLGGGSSGSSSGGSSPVPTSLSGNGNASKVYNYLTGKGLTASAAAGIMGNLQQESGMNPKMSGGGLAQWIGSRQTSLDAYAKQNGTSPNSLNTQLGYLWKELSSGQYGSISALNGMNASQAAQYFEQMFEKAGQPDMGNRINDALGFYNQFANSKSASTQTVHLSQQSVNALTKAMQQTTGLKTASGSVRP